MSAEATAGPSGFDKVALLASPTERAQEAAAALAGSHEWAPVEHADAAVVLGGDGFMLETMHRMIDSGRMIPLYGLNLGTVGFLMNRYRSSRVLERMAKARRIAVSPLKMDAITQAGAVWELRAAAPTMSKKTRWTRPRSSMTAPRC